MYFELKNHSLPKGVRAPGGSIEEGEAWTKMRAKGIRVSTKSLSFDSGWSVTYEKQLVDYHYHYRALFDHLYNGSQFAVPLP